VNPRNLQHATEFFHYYTATQTGQLLSDPIICGLVIEIIHQVGQRQIFFVLKAFGMPLWICCSCTCQQSSSESFFHLQNV